MTYGMRAAIALLALAASGGCGFDFGDESPSAERSGVTVTTNDAGVQTIVGTNGCVFRPCSGAYGTNCGVICPPQQ